MNPMRAPIITILCRASLNKKRETTNGIRKIKNKFPEFLDRPDCRLRRITKVIRC